MGVTRSEGMDIARKAAWSEFGRRNHTSLIFAGFYARAAGVLLVVVGVWWGWVWWVRCGAAGSGGGRAAGGESVREWVGARGGGEWLRGAAVGGVARGGGGGGEGRRASVWGRVGGG